MAQNSSQLRLIMSRRILSVLFLSFSSGLPLALSGSTLQAWYSVANVSLVIIGVLSLTGQPYLFKFLWAPFLDRYSLPWLGRRRGWIVLAQIALVIVLAIMACMQPDINPWPLAIAALVLAFVSATQDVGIDAYVTDLLRDSERGIGASMRTIGYRIAMLVSGGLGMILGAKLGWHTTYLIMAGLLALQILVTWWSPPTVSDKPPSSLKSAVVGPFKEFLRRDDAWLILLLVVIYKFGDALVLALGTPFLIKGVGFSLVEVGSMYKGVGMMATLIGSFIGGLAMTRIALYSALFWFGLLQAVSNLMFMALAIVGKNYMLMVSTIFIESFCGGLATVAFLAFIMSLCDHRYTASQFALLSALSAVGRVVVGPIAGLMVVYWGWTTFYFVAFLAGLPAVLLLFLLRHQIVSTKESAVFTAEKRI